MHSGAQPKYQMNRSMKTVSKLVQLVEMLRTFIRNPRRPIICLMNLVIRFENNSDQGFSLMNLIIW